MKLTVRVNGGPEREIEFDRRDSIVTFSSRDFGPASADVQQPEPGVYSVLLDGRSYEARVEENGDLLVVIIDGRRYEVEARDPRRWSRKSGAGAGEGRQNLIAPMPGKVVRILAAPGDDVSTGQGIIVVEAMKMQNEMRASKPGRVVSITVREGATVNAGEILATIE